MSKKDVTGFKEAFGLSKNNPDPKKLAKSLLKQLQICKASVELLEALQHAGAPAARTAYDNLYGDAITEIQFYQRDNGVKLKQCAMESLNQTKANQLAAKKTPVTVNAGNPAAPVQVFWTDIPGFDEMTPQDRAAAAQKIGEKIARGNNLLGAIVPANGGVSQPPQGLNRNEKRQAVTDIAFALKARAQAKAGPYEKGALTTPGGDELRQFFDSCSDDVYARRSTHLGDQQRKPGQSPRGMDFYDGADTLQGNGAGDGLLPMGMNTILMQMVEDTNGNKRMYIKMETASAYGSAGSKNKKDPLGIPNGGRSDKVDYSELLGHGMNITRNTDKHADLDSHRETTPEGIYDLCKTIVKTCDNKAAKKELVGAMGKDKEKLRINAFMKKLEFWQPIALTSEASKDAIEALQDELDDLFGAGADLSVQAGEEIAL